ncbi:hypothetical protein Pst134EA_028055 [Puccinia striiformis f. sp. tritici]|uniref:hypothetical protein n=1 Tax=Puccinia striiformis f. sp. tritici TaxID=168172 RepID=UPI002007F829|nr:hypothetical protein Pst134EA_028055 [Puccinia striiformis f. sp. tritici]KAH9448760.1 hypothetical protein Pst134EA_028055 [Puccinia striiformis f. sp. tritici]
MSLQRTPTNAAHTPNSIAGDPPLLNLGNPALPATVTQRHRHNNPPPPAPVHTDEQDQAIIDNSKNIKNLVDNAVKDYTTETWLKDNGENYWKWLKMIGMTAQEYLGDSAYYNGPSVRPRLEPAAKRILLRVVSPSMRTELYNLGDSRFASPWSAKLR